jgi:hypothetical protein
MTDILTPRALRSGRPVGVGATRRNRRFNRSGNSVLAMITSASHQPWPADSAITHLTEAGLKAPSVVRLKLFTLDNRFIVRRIGALDVDDRQAVSARVKEYLPRSSGADRP